MRNLARLAYPVPRGLLTDFFICSPEELEHRCHGWLPPLAEPRRVESKNFEMLTLETLVGALPGQSPVSIDPVLFGPQGVEEWVFDVPPGSTATLAALSDPELDGVAQRFVAALREDAEGIADDFTRESQLAGISVETCRPVVVDIREMSRKAVQRQLALHLWVSL